MSLPELDPPLPWAGALAWLFGGRCRARLSRADSPVRYGRCELARQHPDEDHALEYGMHVVRFRDDGATWTSWDRAGQSPVAGWEPIPGHRARQRGTA